jgi:putative peptidoglycan lipid II flippase
MLPHSIIAVSIATPYFTRMSGHAHEGDLASVRGDLSASLRTIGMLIFGAAAAIAASAVPFAAMFGRTDRELEGTTLVLLAFLAGLVPFSTLFLLQRTFYALADTRTPFFIQLAQASIFVLGALLVSLAPSPLIAIGIAAVTTIAGTAQTIITAVVLRRRIGGLDAVRVLRAFGRFALATIPAAAAGLLVLWPLGGFGDGGFATANPFSAAASVVLVGGVALLAYAAAIVVMRVPEFGDLVRPVIRRLRGR